MIKNYLQGIIDIFFPKLCFYCQNQSADYLCQNCYEKIEFLYPPLCRLCSLPIDNNKSGLCKNCIGAHRSYNRIISVTFYKEPLKELIFLFKYKYYEYLGDFLSSIMINHLVKIGIDLKMYDFITAVPTHRIKLKEREYNQTEVLAKFLSNYFQIPFKNDIIYQIKNKISQTTLDSKERQESVKNSFTATKNLKEKKIVLVDDIFTTGATLEECSRLLKMQGAQMILGITLCKTP
ncbi:MAG: double zinc ribbon domain-containing protein [Candidatus Omnitrophica bacterium]|nr:double zinc ribbon domain-containing protein [Candidatus Omnitrophota bacterium]